MRIGWIKFTMGLEFDYNTAHANAGHERGPIARNLVKRGHTLHVYTPMAREEIKTLAIVKETGEKTGDWDNRFMKEIEYDPEGLPDNLDLLIVENAALNFMYTDKNGNPQIRRAAQIIDAHKGLVLYIQGDPDLPFPFHKMAGCVRDWNDEENPYKTGEKRDDLEDFGWATHDEIFKNKKWVVGVRTKQIDEVIESYNMSRVKLKDYVEKGLVNVRYMFCPQPNEYFNELEVKEYPEYDIISVGYPKNREKDFEKLFLFLVKYFNLVVTGTWDRGKNAEYRDACVELGMTNLGFVDGFKNLYETINNSVCSLHLGVGKTKKFGWITGRWTEAIFAKSLTFYDERIKGHDEWLGKAFGVNPTTVYRKFKAAIKLNHEQRSKLWAWQYDQVKWVNISNYCDLIEDICKEFDVDIKGDKKLIKEYEDVWHEKEIPHGIEYTTEEIQDILATFDKEIKPKEQDIKFVNKLRKKEKVKEFIEIQEEEIEESALETFVREEFEDEERNRTTVEPKIPEYIQNTPIPSSMMSTLTEVFPDNDVLNRALDIVEKIVEIIQKRNQ